MDLRCQTVAYPNAVDFQFARTFCLPDSGFACRVGGKQPSWVRQSMAAIPFEQTALARKVGLA